MDRGLWITWYDVREENREAYFRWLHEAYLPALVRRGGIAWAAHYESVPKEARRASAREGVVKRTLDPAVPAGSQYILIAAGTDAHVFGRPSPAQYHAGLPEADRNMLALRVGERVNVMAEAGRVQGPAGSSRAEPAGTACIQLGSFNCEPDHEEEVLGWYTRWRMPAMEVTHGCVRFRTLASVAGWAKHAVLYEFLSLSARNEHFVTHDDADPEMKAVSDRMVGYLTHAPGSANVAVRTWPPVPAGTGAPGIETGDGK